MISLIREGRFHPNNPVVAYGESTALDKAEKPGPEPVGELYKEGFFMVESDFIDLDEGTEVPIKAWSHSRIVVFETCKRRAELAYIERIPEPPRPLPPGKTEHANDRGTRIHTAAELYVKGGVELIPELAHFAPEMDKLRAMYKAGSVSLEGEWAYTRDWKPVPWMSADVWSRIKLDVIAFMNAEWAVVIDYKSGKRFGNEIKHGEQTQLYQLASFIRYPKIKRVTTELWYTDQNELYSMEYTREQGLRFLANFEKRGEKLTTCEEFPPNPSPFTCKWCPYKSIEKGGTGHCSVGV